jgi:uncharacterized protein (TIGR02466 family)
MASADNYRFSADEERIIAELAMVKNLGNAMSENDRLLDMAELASVRKFIDAQILVYKKQILHMRDQNEVYITQSWANKAGKGEYHPMHKHPNSVFSGVMFVNGEEGDGLPPIRFHRANELLPLDFGFDQLNDFNAGMRWFPPVKGQLMLFPSVLLHDVGVNGTNTDRITLSFNTFVRGKIGTKARLNEANLGA